ETALKKSQDDLGTATSNTARGLRINPDNGSRHAYGTIYIGVTTAASNYGWCETYVSSDKVDDTHKLLHVGEAISLTSSRGKYRIVLTRVDSRDCTFDLVKD